MYNYHINIFFYYGLSLLSIIVLIVNNYKVNRSIIYFVSYTLLLGFVNSIFDVVVNSDSSIIQYIYVYNFEPLLIISGPLLYKFIHSYIYQNFRLRFKDLLHLIPYILVLVVLFHKNAELYELIKNKGIDIADIQISKEINCVVKNFRYLVIFRCFVRFCYSLLSMFVLYSFYKSSKMYFKGIRDDYFRIFLWLTFFVAYYIIISIFQLIDMIVYFGTHSSIYDVIFHKSTYIIYSIFPLIMYAYPKILYDFPLINFKNDESSLLNTPSGKNWINIQQYEVDLMNFSEEFTKENIKYIELGNQILQYVKNEQPFLNPYFSTHDICSHFQIHRHQLHMCLKLILNTSFSDLKNRLRINYAIELFKREDYKNMSIEGIGYKSGFLSNSSFYKSFKDITGYTPNDWLKKNQVQDDK